MQPHYSERINFIDVGSAGDLPEPWSQHQRLIGKCLRFEPREKGENNEEIVSLNTMLWENEEVRNFFIYRGKNGSGSSLFLQNYDYVLKNFDTLKKNGPPHLADTWLERSLPVDVQPVACQTLDNVLQELNSVHKYHFMKIDAQGAEYQILKGAQNYLENDCYGLQLELFQIPLYKGITLLEDVVHYLEELDFQLVKKYPAHGSFNSQHECIFLRKGLNNRIMSMIRQAYQLPPAEAAPPACRTASLRNVLDHSRNKLQALQNIHRDKRCVIIGNGPSLNKMDLSFLKDEITFGMNRIFLAFDKWNFMPTYYVAVNRLVLEQNADRIECIPCPRFVRGDQGYKFLSDNRNTYFLDLVLNKGEFFSKNIVHGYFEGATVTYVAMQLAYFMGFSEVILIGVDHYFSTPGAPNQEVVSQGPDPNHFTPGYFGPGIKWHLPDLEQSERAYRLAKKAYQESGRIILDATVDGKLTVFPKMDYREIFYHNIPRSVPVPDIIMLNQTGEELFAKGDIKGALTFFNKALSHTAEHPMTNNNLGVLYYTMGNLKMASHHLQKAIASDPNNHLYKRNMEMLADC